MASALLIERIQPLIGAEISGVDLREPITEEAAAVIRQALLDHQVLVFRNQPISREQHRNFALIFARNAAEPFAIQENRARQIDGFPEVLVVAADGAKNSAADVWHSDESFREIPPAVCVLKSHVIPSFGGDTVFSSCVHAYDRLSDDVKSEIRDLKALHGPVYTDRGGYNRATYSDPAKRQKQIEENPPRAQPVVRLHPETGKPVLFVNKGYCGGIVGYDEEESNRLMAFLLEEATRPDYQLRVKWSPDTIVIWDNRAVQHYAVYDYNEPRHMERITISGEAPCVGPAPREFNETASESNRIAVT